MLFILLRAQHTSMSSDQMLILTVFLGVIIGLIITGIGTNKYKEAAKIFLFSLIIESILCGIIAFISLAWSIGIMYGAVFGTIFSLILSHIGNRR